MLNIEIQKEIRGDNKIAIGMNIRQLIVASIAGTVSLLVYFNLKDMFEMEEIMMIILIISAIAWWFGWHMKSGLHGEQLIYLKIKDMVSRKTGRIYQTENGYVKLMSKKNLDSNRNNKLKKINNKSSISEKKQKSGYTPIM